jgi:two-component system nitrogen regulation response regulator NtrX
VILVVEDRADVRLGVAELLELNGFQVSDAANAEQALAFLSAQPEACALVLLDLMLPGKLSGAEMRARQLADPHLAMIPTVVVSASDPSPLARAELHASEWLDKPFHCDELLQVVRRYVVPEHTVAG